MEDDDKNANVSMNPPISTTTPHLSKDKDAMPYSRSISRNAMSLIEDGKGKLDPRGLRYTRQAMRKRSLLASPQTVAEARWVKLQQYLYTDEDK